MSWTKITIDTADKHFSRYIRLKRKKCDYCGKPGAGKEGITGLQASHFHSRRKESVRFDEENVDVLCIVCHRDLGTYNKPGYEAWKLRQLGEQKFNLLLVRANTYAKKDRKLQALIWKEALKKLQ